MNLADIPLPEKQSGLTILEHDQAYPTMPGKAAGVVHMEQRDERGEHKRSCPTTVQCAACLRTATGHTPWWVIVVSHWNHANDPDGETRQPTPYKRCPDCRAAARHPEPTLFEVTA